MWDISRCTLQLSRNNFHILVDESSCDSQQVRWQKLLGCRSLIVERPCTWSTAARSLLSRWNLTCYCLTIALSRLACVYLLCFSGEWLAVYQCVKLHCVLTALSRLMCVYLLCFSGEWLALYQCIMLHSVLTVTSSHYRVYVFCWYVAGH